jgi:large-conductance mechanosensitive channel
MGLINNAFDNLLLPLILLALFLLCCWILKLFHFLRSDNFWKPFIKFALLCVPIGIILGIAHFSSVWSVHTPSVYVDGEIINQGRAYEGLDLLQKFSFLPISTVMDYFITDVIGWIIICLQILAVILLIHNWRQKKQNESFIAKEILKKRLDKFGE